MAMPEGFGITGFPFARFAHDPFPANDKDFSHTLEMDDVRVCCFPATSHQSRKSQIKNALNHSRSKTLLLRPIRRPL